MNRISSALMEECANVSGERVHGAGKYGERDAWERKKRTNRLRRRCARGQTRTTRARRRCASNQPRTEWMRRQEKQQRTSYEDQLIGPGDAEEPGATWLLQVHDRLCHCCTPILKWMGIAGRDREGRGREDR
ncbi:hypothetical protein NDU88_002827 [Pleurodeles waltl]|uniref:Uncharacterized protein n=1 Tax=Pleurodeles waltl TaxID=8319 RepID=A0AAV7KTW6_PLEWA|nr:hypothetical protein NDU88_002827 [Pleurodeles waltl]